MTDDDVGELEVVSDLPAIQTNRIEGPQVLSTEPGENQLKAQTAAQRHELATRKQQHDPTEERKRNDRDHLFRAVEFGLVMAVLVVSIGWGGFAAVYADDVETRNWG